MALQDWQDGVFGGTPLTAARLNDRDHTLQGVLVQFASDPSLIWSGHVTRDANGAATSAAVTWPDGVTGTYSGTASTVFPSAIDAYTITRAGTPFVTFTQAAVTRDASGNITNRPPITAS